MPSPKSVGPLKYIKPILSEVNFQLWELLKTDFKNLKRRFFSPKGMPLA